MKGSLLILPLFLTISCYCQNLVPNPGFEEYNDCPGGLSAISYSPSYMDFPTVRYWIRPLKMTTPDYFNACFQKNTDYPVGVPQNFTGYHPPHAGNAYTGIVSWYTYHDTAGIHFYSEYVESKLLQPLVRDHIYAVSFFIRLTLFSEPHTSIIGAKDISIHLSDTEVYSQDDKALTLSPHLSPSYITDTLNWVKIEGQYVAHGNEQWITIGNFIHNYAAYKEQLVKQGDSLNWQSTYILLDDISIIDITKHNENTLALLHDTSICASNFPVSIGNKTGGAKYKWNNGVTAPFMIVTNPGTFWRQSQIGTNTTIDTFRVYQFHKLNLGSDGTYRYGTHVKINSNHNYNSYRWNVGIVNEPILDVRDKGQYILTVNDECGSQTDTVNINFY